MCAPNKQPSSLPGKFYRATMNVTHSKAARICSIINLWWKKKKAKWTARYSYTLRVLLEILHGFSYPTSWNLYQLGHWHLRYASQSIASTISYHLHFKYLLTGVRVEYGKIFPWAGSDNSVSHRRVEYSLRVICTYSALKSVINLLDMVMVSLVVWAPSDSVQTGWADNIFCW